MTAVDRSVSLLDGPSRTSVPVPARIRPCLTTRPGDRTLRQVQGIDVWNASLRLRQALLRDSGRSREGRLDGARRLDVLRRTHAAVAQSTARELARSPAPMLASGPTAVVAHHHPWFRDKVCALLAEHGFEVVEQTDNGADALGIIIAEQPDLVLVGDRLTMMTTAELLAETALFSPLSVRLAPAAGGDSSLRAVTRRVAGGDEHEDAPVARIFAALCDPLSLRLLLHAVEVGEYDLKAASRLATTSTDAAARLDHLVDVGLLARSHVGRPTEVYCVADAASVGVLLDKLQQLGTPCRAARGTRSSR